GLNRDTVLDQHFGGPVGEADVIATATIDRPNAVVDIHSLQLDTEGVIDPEGITKPERVINVLRPAIGAPEEVDAVVVAVLNGEVFNSRVLRKRCLEVVQLRLVAEAVGDRQRRVE